MLIGSRGGFNAINGDHLSELGKDLSAWDVISAFLYGEKYYIEGPVKTFHIVLIVIILLFVSYCIRLMYHNFSVDYVMLLFVLTSFFVSVSWMMISQGHAYLHKHLTIVLWFYCFLPALGVWCGKNIQIIVGNMLKKVNEE